MTTNSLCWVEREGNEEAWNDFYLMMGRYVVAAGNAEAFMFILLMDMERLVGKPISTESPPWAQLVERLEKVSANTPYEDRVRYLLRGARRRGRLRNDRIHTGWVMATDISYSGRRFYSKKGKNHAEVLMDRDGMVNDVQMMTKFADDLEAMAAEAQYHWTL